MKIFKIFFPDAETDIVAFQQFIDEERQADLEMLADFASNIGCDQLNEELNKFHSLLSENLESVQDLFHPLSGIFDICQYHNQTNSGFEYVRQAVDAYSNAESWKVPGATAELDLLSQGPLAQLFRMEVYDTLIPQMLTLLEPYRDSGAFSDLAHLADLLREVDQYCGNMPESTIAAVEALVLKSNDECSEEEFNNLMAETGGEFHG